MKHFIASGIVSAAVGLTTMSASASITASYVGYGSFQTHGVGYSSDLAWDASSTVTMFNLKLAEHQWDIGGSTVYSWCAQVFQGITAGSTYTFDVVALEFAPQAPPAPGPMGVAKATLLRDAMARFLGSDGRVIATVGNHAAGSAAFCALAWEIIHENVSTTDVEIAKARLSLATGAFRANLTGEAASIYSAMVGSLGVGGYSSVAAEGWNSPTAQDQFRVVPAPGALALLGLAGLAARRRR
jgi:hypothetical protein